MTKKGKTLLVVLWWTL